MSPDTAETEVRVEGRRDRSARVLAALVLATLPFGSIWSLGVGTHQLPLYPSYLPLFLLFAHLGLSRVVRIVRHDETRRSAITILALPGALLAIPVFISLSFQTAVLAYMNFALGLFGALAVGSAWKTGRPDRRNIVDLGLMCFVFVGAFQLGLELLGAVSTDQLHQAATTEWGGSNYVAGVLVVGAYLLIARARPYGVSSIFMYVVAVIAGIVSLLTFSRGAVIALALGAIVALWNAGRSPGRRIILRVLTIVVPVLGYALVSNAVAVRSQVNDQAAVNVSARFELYRLGLSQFLSSPLIGTGWASLRDASQNALGVAESFAHNIVISFAQIGGIIGIFYVVTLIGLVIMALRSKSLAAAAVVAAVGISMTDPFFEGYIGGLTAVAGLVLCLPVRPAVPVGEAS